MRLKMASRKSDLARLQLQTVGQYLKNKISVEPELIYRESFGDKNLDIDLAGSENKGLFTQDFYDALVNSEVDMVVHSWKDLPIEDNKTTIALTLPRHDARDLLLVKKSKLEKIKKNQEITVMTSSPRREFFISEHLNKLYPVDLKKINFAPIRGNIPTRLSKLLKSDFDALVMAKAAVDRMLSAKGEEFNDIKSEIRSGLEQCEWMVLPLSLFPSAAAQGALAVEVLKGSELEKQLQNINFKDDFETVSLERKKLKELGGGCHSRLGVNYLRRSFGVIHHLSREVNGKLEQKTELLHRKFFSKANKSTLWPVDKKIPATRKAINVDLKELSLKSGLWVTKSAAFPKGYAPSLEQKIWTSGLVSWEKLADQGVWVHGSSESLGEKEDMRLDILLPESFKWTKLAHSTGVKTEKGFLGTYEVEWNFKKEDFRGCEHFYWMSGEMFKQAVLVDPNIKSKNHYCGPGHTYDALKNILNPEKLFVCLGYEDWKKEIIK